MLIMVKMVMMEEVGMMVEVEIMVEMVMMEEEGMMVELRMIVFGDTPP